MKEKMKRERYELLCKQVESLAAGETNVVGVLANVSAAMKTMFPEEFFWVGFYIVASPPALPYREGALQVGDSAPYKSAHPDIYNILKANSLNHRNNPTEAEKILWEVLRANNLGVKFRRQHAIGDYIADFVCLSRYLIIEVDGGYHNKPEQKELDAIRSDYLHNRGFRILRFTNEQVIGNIDSVIKDIQSSLSQPAIPLPAGEGVGERPTLLLGPFQGTVACYSIPYGKGVCGTAWKERKTLVVPDVEEFPGHIACSSLSRSEIVVPMFLPDEEEEDGLGEVWGVIDIDSTELGTFDEVDAEYLERIAKILSEVIYNGNTLK